MPATSTRLADFVPYQMSIATNAVSDLIAGEYRARFGLKIPEWRVMAVLGDAGALTQRELVGGTRMDKVAVNRACNALEQRGLAARSPNARDGRSHHLELTATGKAVHAQIMPLALAMEKQLLAVFDPHELASFKAMLARVTHQAQTLDRASPAPTTGDE